MNQITGSNHPATMPADYDGAMCRLLAEVGATPGVVPDDFAGFWPEVGHAYQGRLLVVGRAVNGSVSRVRLDDLRAVGGPEATARLLRRTAEGDGPSPMGWVVARWGSRDGYSSARSAFWRFVRRVLAHLDPASVADPWWSNRLAWTNLAKIAPWGGGNPGGALLDVQRRVGPELLGLEVGELRPEVVLVLTGRWWFEPFAEHLGLVVDWRKGRLEGVADEDGGRRWIIAPHPQGKPRALVDEVLGVL